MAFEQRAARSHFWLQNQLLNWSKWYTFFCICSPRKDLTGLPSRSYIFLLSSVSMTQESKWSQGSHHLFCNIIGFLNKCPLELDIPYFGTAFNITLWFKEIISKSRQPDDMSWAPCGFLTWNRSGSNTESWKKDYLYFVQLVHTWPSCKGNMALGERTLIDLSHFQFK